jgi:adenine-specific DNA-methyltransferase
VSSEPGAGHLAKLLGSNVFEFPKDELVLQQFIEMATGDNDIVLDFFAGSGTTAHATINENATHGKNLSYVLVQLPEPCDDTSGASDGSYKTIADVARKRIRLASRQIESERSEQLNLDSGKLDLGFRSFALSRSNFKVWNGEESAESDLGKQIDMHIDHLSNASTPEDVLYELLLKAGFALTTKVQSVSMANKKVFSIEDGALLICLEKEITPELIDALAEANPLQVICLDEGFKGNDQLKTNAVQTFRARAEAEESEIVFRTV